MILKYKICESLTIIFAFYLFSACTSSGCPRGDSQIARLPHHPQVHLEQPVLVLGEGYQLRLSINHAIVEFSEFFRSLDCRGASLGHVYVSLYTLFTSQYLFKSQSHPNADIGSGQDLLHFLQLHLEQGNQHLLIHQLAVDHS